MSDIESLMNSHYCSTPPHHTTHNTHSFSPGFTLFPPSSVAECIWVNCLLLISEALAGFSAPRMLLRGGTLCFPCLVCTDGRRKTFDQIKCRPKKPHSLNTTPVYSSFSGDSLKHANLTVILACSWLIPLV